MASITTPFIEQRLLQVLTFLKPYLKFVNCHMVNYFTDNHWENFLSQDLRDEVESVDQLSGLINHLMINGFKSDTLPVLNNLIQTTKANTLFGMTDICLSVDDFQKLYLPSEQLLYNPLPIKEFMSPKKNHEVGLMSSLVASLCQSVAYKDTVIIDAGDGKGYLSSRLALEHKLSVIGIDSSQVNTAGAKKRNEKLGRAWNVLVDRAEKEKAGTLQRGRRRNKSTKNENGQSHQEDLYKTVTQFIEADTDFSKLVTDCFPNRTFTSYCLTGLHTCGNLAPNCLNIFQSNPEIRIICNVGCCYHLMTEQFVHEAKDLSFNSFHQQRELSLSTQNASTFKGFPLSNFLKQGRYFLGRNARMLASQSVNRFFAEQKLPEISLLYRAMLQVLIEKRLTPQESEYLLVGKSKSSNFLDYVQLSFKKFSIECPSVEEILSTECQYKEKWEQMQLFYIIRMLFAPVIETVIILDRLLYLKENGLDQSFVVEMFNPVISPRCYGIISIKDFKTYIFKSVTHDFIKIIKIVISSLKLFQQFEDGG